MQGESDMEKNHKDYPNEEDYDMNANRQGKEQEDLPLADPSESNATKTFQENEGKEDEGTNEKSAFGHNKEGQ